MKKLSYLIPLAAAALLLLVPDLADGRGGRPRPEAGSGPGADTGGSSGSGSGSSDSGSAPPTRPPGAEDSGPRDDLGDGKTADAPKNPANAMRDEIRLHTQLVAWQCAQDRAWDLLWRAYDDGRGQVNEQAGACPQAELPAEDEAPVDGGENPDSGSADQDPPAEDPDGGREE